MTDADRAAKVLAANAVDRAPVAAELAKQAAKPWRVLRQHPNLPDTEVCRHRWEWQADLCAYRKTRSHPHTCGGHYTVRREPSR